MQRALVFDLPAHLDAEGRVIALSLSLEATHHNVIMGGRRLHNWCMGQALKCPVLLDLPVRLESPCRASGRPILIDFAPTPMASVEPSAAVVGSHALANPSPKLQQCDDKRVFSSTAAAEPWSKKHPGAGILPMDEAYARYLPMVRALG